jgi:hypothetical protein
VFVIDPAAEGALSAGFDPVVEFEFVAGFAAAEVFVLPFLLAAADEFVLPGLDFEFELPDEANALSRADVAFLLPAVD